MTNAPNSSPIAQDETPASDQNFLVRHLLNLIGLACSYLLGILLSVMLTDAEFVLAGKNLFPWYVCMFICFSPCCSVSANIDVIPLTKPAGHYPPNQV